MFASDTKVEGLVLYEPDTKSYSNYDCIFLPHEDLSKFLTEAVQSPNQFFASLRLCARLESKAVAGSTQCDYYIPQARVIDRRLSLTLKPYRLVGESYLELMNSDPNVPSCIHIPSNMTPQSMDQKHIIQTGGLTPAQSKRMKLKAKAQQLKNNKDAEAKIAKFLAGSPGSTPTVADLQRVVGEAKAMPTADDLGKVLGKLDTPPAAGGFTTDPQAKSIIDRIRATADKTPGATPAPTPDALARKRAKRARQNAKAKAKAGAGAPAGSVAGFGGMSSTAVGGTGIPDVSDLLTRAVGEAKKETDALTGPPKPEELLGLIQKIAGNIGSVMPGSQGADLQSAMGGIGGMLASMGIVVPASAGAGPTAEGPVFSDD